MLASMKNASRQIIESYSIIKYETEEYATQKDV